MKKWLNDISRILTRKEKNKFLRLVVLDIVVSVLDISFLLLLVFVVGYYTGTFSPGNLPVPVADLLTRYPLLLITLFLVMFVLKNGGGFLLFRKQFRFLYEVASRISGKNLSGYLNGSYTDYINTDPSVHTRKISLQPVEFSHHVLRGVQQMISNLVLVVLSIIPLLLFQPLLCLMLFMVLLPPVILTGWLTKKRLAALRRSGKLNKEKSIQYLQEALSGYIESNIYDRKHFFLRRYRQYQDRFNAGLAEHQVMQHLPSRLMEVFAVFGLFLLIVFHVYTSPPGSVNVLLIGGFMAAAYKIIPGVVKVLNSREQIKTYSYTIKELLEKEAVPGERGPHPPCPLESVEFRKVSFGFRQENVLTDFSMSLRKGDFTGLSGVSGRGKTTIINLLLGFLDPGAGQILLNNTPVAAKERQAYWSAVSYIRQQSFFIHDSIRNNITLQEQFEQDRLTKALQLSGVDNLATEHPQGIETILSENGKNVSGGQRQRIMLARALYKDAGLIILDEPFSEMDRVAEDRLLNYFRELAATGKIVLLITHSRESLSFCNKIISLDEA